VAQRKLSFAIVGAGPGGMCMGIRLREAGFEDFVILEKADGVGGTWRHNRYPGCECDVPSHLYSFSFDLKPDWTKPYAVQPEILEYLEACAERHGLPPHCRFNTAVVEASWDEQQASWSVRCNNGDVVQADVLVGAVGMFNEPAFPSIEGLDDFAGTVFHSSRWDDDHDFAGETVAIIGSAASAVQLVPNMAAVADQTYLFQRTANWVLPKLDDPYTAAQIEHFKVDDSDLRALRDQTYANFEVGSTFSNPKVLADRERVGLSAIEVVDDPELREKLKPLHPFGCKRPLLSNDYYPAFNRPDLELVTEEIARIGGQSVVTANGRERQIDTLILATGFQTTKYLSTIAVTGRDGRHLDDAWQDGAQAYVGITTAGFPNMFMLYGPNTNNGSIITMLEHQVDHVLQHVQKLANDDVSWIDVRPDAMAGYNAELQEVLDGVGVWNADCNGYYRSASGRIVTQWPMSMAEYRNRTAAIDWDAFEVAPASS
jgi:cation diffusion facilitator CzcD-associated flavoprotein CzcO